MDVNSWRMIARTRADVSGRLLPVDPRPGLRPPRASMTAARGSGDTPRLTRSSGPPLLPLRAAGGPDAPLQTSASLLSDVTAYKNREPRGSPHWNKSGEQHLYDEVDVERALLLSPCKLVLMFVQFLIGLEGGGGECHTMRVQRTVHAQVRERTATARYLPSPRIPVPRLNSPKITLHLR